jgi:hypothetical protein
MTTQPIAGNQNFTVITNAAAQLSELNVGKLAVADGRLTEFTVIGYAPNGFGTAAVGTKLNLNNAPGKDQAVSTTDPNLLRLPKRVKVLSAYATNNGTTITGSGAQLDVGLNATLAASPSAPPALVDTSIANVNTGVFGVPSAPPGVVATTTETFGAVEVKTAALTTGDLKVILTLVELP